jgi:phospholipid/cholesterol/gamma-HCH transport system substrate-binding protein
MNSKISALRLGIFIFLGSILLIVTVFLIGNKEGMFAPTFKVKVYFSNIEGLRNGAPVRLSGINVGSVSNIKIASDSAGKVEVTLRLSSDVKQFIRGDSKASIETEGLVGNKVVVLRMGTVSSKEVEDGGIVQGVEPLGFGAIIEETQGIMTYTKDMTSNLAEIIRKVNEGEGSIGKLINDDALYNNTNNLIVSADRSLSSIADRLDTLGSFITNLGLGVKSVVQNVDKVVIDIDTVISNINQGKGLLGTLISESSGYDSSISSVLINLVKITEETKLGAIRFAENMEALKRNWLFKSYFEQRGYYDKTEYEKQLDNYMNEVNERIKVLDQRISTLKKLENKVGTDK